MKSIKYRHLIPKGWRRCRVGVRLPIGNYSYITDEGEIVTRPRGQGLRLPLGFESHIYLIQKYT